MNKQDVQSVYLFIDQIEHLNYSQLILEKILGTERERETQREKCLLNFILIV